MGVYKELEETFNYDIVDEFLDHFEMMCSAMEPTILHTRDPEFYKREIEELFRMLHNIKSATGFLRLETMHRTAGFVENLLEECRKLEGPATEELVNWLLLVSDQFNRWLDDLHKDAPEYAKLDMKIMETPVELETK